MRRIPYRLIAPLVFGIALLASGPVEAAPKTSADFVKMSVKAEKPVDGKQVVTITLNITKGWHAFANPVGLDDLFTVQTTVAFSSAGKAIPVKVTYPEGRLVKDAVVGDYRIYEGVVTINAAFKREGTEPIDGVLFVRTVNDQVCILPSTIKFKIE